MICFVLHCYHTYVETDVNGFSFFCRYSNWSNRSLNPTGVHMNLRSVGEHLCVERGRGEEMLTGKKKAGLRLISL